MDSRVLVAISLMSLAAIVNCNEYQITSKEFNKAYHINKDHRRTFNESFAYCRDIGDQLIMIRSEQESEFLKREINFFYMYWMGASPIDGRLSTNHPTKFLDGLPITWYNWEYGHPNGREDCAGIAFSVNEMTWSKVDCNSEYYTICERPLLSNELLINNTINELMMNEVNYNFQHLINMTNCLQVASILINNSLIESKVNSYQVQLYENARQELLKTIDELAMKKLELELMRNKTIELETKLAIIDPDQRIRDEGLKRDKCDDGAPIRCLKNCEACTAQGHPRGPGISSSALQFSCCSLSCGCQYGVVSG